MTDTPQQTPASKGTVLLVDDDKFLVDMYSAKFTHEGYAVNAFLSANNALDALRKGLQPNVILFDLIMPERDGFSFLEALSGEKLGQGAVKIALTNQNDEAEHTRAQQLGADHYIVKASKIPSEVVNTVANEITAQRHA